MIIAFLVATSAVTQMQISYPIVTNSNFMVPTKLMEDDIFPQEPLSVF